MFVISEIELPKGEEAAEFADFVQEKWMPTVRMGPTRVGQVDDLRLLQQVSAGEADDAGAERFLLLVDWDGLPLADGGRWTEDEILVRGLKRFGAKVKDSAGWREVARVDPEAGPSSS